MSLAHFTGASAFLIVCLMGAACAAPTTPSSGSPSNIEPDSQANDELPDINATTENQSSESAATVLGVELTSEFPEDVKCRSAWQKFLVDFDVHYASDSESQKRRKIFCANWQRIQDHNAQYELGKVSHKKSINQWADLTFEEWTNKQRPILAPEFAEVKPTTDSTEEGSRKKEEPSPIEELEKPHPAAFPPSLDVPGNKTEATEVKSDWPGSQQYWFPPNMEGPGTYVADPQTDSKPLEGEEEDELRGIKDKEEPPTMELSGNNTDASEVDLIWIQCQAAWEKFLTDFGSKYENEAETEKRRNIFCDNWQRIQDHNAQYELGKVSHKKSINQWADLTFEEWTNKQRPILAPEFAEVPEEGRRKKEEPSPIEDPEEQHPAAFPPNMDVPENKTEATEVKADSPPNMEEPGTYIAEPQIIPNNLLKTYLTVEEPSPIVELEKQHSVAFPPNSDLPGNKTEASEVKGDWPGSQQYWFSPNMEEPGTYVPEPTTTSKPLDEEQTDEVRRTEDKEKPPSMEIPGNKTDESEIDRKRIECQAAWEKFQTDFGSKYENETETEKRRNIFCANWQRIQEHNTQYELRKVTHKKSINQWADLTFEEWKKQQESSFPPNMEEPGTYLEPNELTDESASSPNLKLLGNETEVEEVNEQDMKSGFEEWLKLQLELDKFPPNMEEPGTYLAEPRTESTSLEVETTDKVPRIEDKEKSPFIKPSTDRLIELQKSASSFDLKQLGNKTDVEEVDEQDMKSGFEEWLKLQLELDKFPPNMEEPGTYLAEPRTESTSLEEETTDEVPRIEDKEEPPNMELPGNKSEETEVMADSPGSQQYWFPPNLEKNGTYIAEPPMKSKSSKDK